MPADLPAGTVNLMAGGAGLPAVQAVLFLVLLFAVSVWDIKHREIPDRLQAAVAMTAFLDFSPADPAGLLTALPYLLAALAVPETEGIGGGDIKLAAAAGIVLGLPAGLAASAIGLSGFIVYGLACSAMKRSRGNAWKAAYPVGPFLAAGSAAAYFLKMKGLIL